MALSGEEEEEEKENRASGPGLSEMSGAVRPASAAQASHDSSELASPSIRISARGHHTSPPSSSRRPLRCAALPRQSTRQNMYDPRSCSF